MGAQFRPSTYASHARWATLLSRALWVVLLWMPARGQSSPAKVITAAPVLQKETLCHPWEAVYFSCLLDNAERSLVSVCGSTKLSEQGGYLQLRQQEMGRVTAFPPKSAKPHEAFTLTMMGHGAAAGQCFFTLTAQAREQTYSVHSDTLCFPKEKGELDAHEPASLVVGGLTTACLKVSADNLAMLRCQVPTRQYARFSGGASSVPPRECGQR